MNKFLLTILTFCLSAGLWAQNGAIVPKATTYEEIVKRGTGYKGTADVVITLGQDDSFKGGIGLSTIQGYQITRKLFTGAGIGLTYYTLPSDEAVDEIIDSDDEDQTYYPPKEAFLFLPLFANMKYSFRNSGEDGMFLSVNAGYSPFLDADYDDLQQHKFRSEYSGGFYFSPKIGYLLNMEPTYGMTISAGYELQRYHMQGRLVGINSFVLTVGVVWNHNRQRL